MLLLLLLRVLLPCVQAFFFADTSSGSSPTLASALPDIMTSIITTSMNIHINISISIIISSSSTTTTAAATTTTATTNTNNSNNKTNIDAFQS